MTETKQVITEIKQLEENEIKTEKSESDEHRTEGKESNESGKVESDENEPPQRKDSTFDRFVSWWKGKPTAETDLKADNEENKKTGEENEKTGEENEKTGEKNEIKGEGTLNDVNVDVDSTEIVDQKKTEQEKPTLIEKEVGDLEKYLNQRIDGIKESSERLLIIEEEDRSPKTAPLAQAEEEYFSDVDIRRPFIDRQVEQPKVAEAVEAVKDNEEKALPEDYIDANSEKKKARVEAFLPLHQRPKRSDHSVDKASEHDERDPQSGNHKPLSTEPAAKPKGPIQQIKMDEVIQEQNRDDTRKENMDMTWKNIDNMEPGTKQYRVSYTVRTTSVDKTKDDKKPSTDDEEERLFGKHVFVGDRRAKPQDPPPENLESEIQEEVAKEDEAATEDIDAIFAMMEKDAGHDQVTVNSAKNVESTPTAPEDPEDPEDIFRKLHSWDDEPTDWWTSTKKKQEYEEWMKPMKDGTIRRVIIPEVEIPYKACVRFITDWAIREEWDKTFSEIQVLKSDKNSKIVYCPVKKRDLTFEILDKQETEPPCHVMSWKKQEAAKDRADGRKPLQFITHTCGFILRPAESGDHATKIVILCQIEGAIDSALKTTFLSGHPKTWLSNLKKYYKKQQKGDPKKVVYL